MKERRWLRIRNFVQILAGHFLRSDVSDKPYITHKFWTNQAGSDFKEKQNAISFYRRWKKKIIPEIPEERLLVY